MVFNQLDYKDTSKSIPELDDQLVRLVNSKFWEKETSLNNKVKTT